MAEKELKPLQWIAGAPKRTTCVHGCSTAKGKRIAWDPNSERFVCETHGLERDAEIKAQLASQSSVAGTGGASPGKMALGPSTGESRPPPQATEASKSSEPGKGTSAPAATETAGGTGARAGPTPLPEVPKGSEAPSTPTPVVSVVLMGPDAIASLKQIVGPTRAYSFVALGARNDPLRVEQGDYNLEGESAEESLERVAQIAKARYIALQAEMRGGSP